VEPIHTVAIPASLGHQIDHSGERKRWNEVQEIVHLVRDSVDSQVQHARNHSQPDCNRVANDRCGLRFRQENRQEHRDRYLREAPTNHNHDEEGLTRLCEHLDVVYLRPNY
jgi:hypothetical protein